jgi:hypothetical protein
MNQTEQDVRNIMANNNLPPDVKAKSIFLLGRQGESFMHANNPSNALIERYNQLKEGLFSSSQPPGKGWALEGSRK